MYLLPFPPPRLPTYLLATWTATLPYALHAAHACCHAWWTFCHALPSLSLCPILPVSLLTPIAFRLTYLYLVLRAFYAFCLLVVDGRRTRARKTPTTTATKRGSATHAASPALRAAFLGFTCALAVAHFVADQICETRTPHALPLLSYVLLSRALLSCLSFCLAFWNGHFMLLFSTDRNERARHDGRTDGHLHASPTHAPPPPHFVPFAFYCLNTLHLWRSFCVSPFSALSGACPA